jgi:hypothetical protein
MLLLPPQILIAAAQNIKPCDPNYIKKMCLRLYSYNDHDSRDHGYTTTGYLDLYTKNTIYKNSRILVKNICVITCVHSTPAVTAEGKRYNRRGYCYHP